jgi:hypothetical protein
VATCITVPGTYTVTLAPWSIGTADPNHQFAAITSLVLGAARGPGKQTLVVLGQSSPNNSNEQVNTTGLSTTEPSLVTAHGRLVLSSTNGGEKAKGSPYGGDAVVTGGPFTNYGAVTTMVQSPNNKAANYTQFYSALTNEPTASVTDRSGLLDVNLVTNDGTWTVAPAASMDLAFQAPGSDYPAGVFTNSGTVVNRGAISAQQGTWAQVGGPVRGNPVVLQDATKLVDRSGAARFLVNSGSADLVGTVPHGQTITVVGEPFNYQGENYDSTALGLDGTTVVNDGTIVLDAQGTKATGGLAVVNDGALRNNGTVRAEVHGSTWTVNWQVGLTNNRSGQVTVTGGTMNEPGGGSVANAGTVTVGPRAAWLLQEGSAFTNEPGGTMALQIAGPTNFGELQIASPCCAGAGAVNAGGALVPVLVGGYKPPAAQEFPVFQLSGGKFTGTFSRVGGGFTVDYKHETTTPAFVGVIYET